MRTGTRSMTGRQANAVAKSYPSRLFVLLLCCASLATARAQDENALKVRLHDAARQSSLTTDGLTPWHMKLEVQLFDAQSKPGQQATIESWWAAPDSWRVTYTLPTSTLTELHTSEGTYRTRDTQQPILLQDVFHQYFRPMGRPNEIDDSTPELRKQKFGQVELDCIMLDQPIKNVTHPPLGLFPTFCLTSGKQDLRLVVDTGSLIFARERLGDFEGRSIPVDMRAQSGETTLAISHLTVLSTMKPDAMNLTATPDLLPVGKQAEVSGAVIAGHILSKTSPIYPESARQNHLSGSVLLRALIGSDGRVHSLRVLSTPGPDLAISALAAVRQWVYTPYLLNGMPTDVDTTITVNYSLSR